MKSSASNIFCNHAHAFELKRCQIKYFPGSPKSKAHTFSTSTETYAFKVHLCIEILNGKAKFDICWTTENLGES